MEAAEDRGKISGVWEDPIMFSLLMFLFFQNKEENSSQWELPEACWQFLFPMNH